MKFVVRPSPGGILMLLTYTNKKRREHHRHLPIVVASIWRGRMIWEGRGRTQALMNYFREWPL